MINQIELNILRTQSQSYEGTAMEILNAAMRLQKRASQYLSSFIFGSGSYNIDGFTESMNMNCLLSSIRIVVLFLTLPMTKDEWPWVDPD